MRAPRLRLLILPLSTRYLHVFSYIRPEQSHAGRGPSCAQRQTGSGGQMGTVGQSSPPAWELEIAAAPGQPERVHPGEGESGMSRWPADGMVTGDAHQGHQGAPAERWDLSLGADGLALCSAESRGHARCCHFALGQGLGSGAPGTPFPPGLQA